MTLFESLRGIVLENMYLEQRNYIRQMEQFGGSPIFHTMRARHNAYQKAMQEELQNIANMIKNQEGESNNE